LFGDPAALIGSDAFADIHPDDRDRIRQVFQETLITGQGRRVEYRCVPKDGGIRHVESQRRVVRDQAGEAACVVVVSRDVTERERTARKIREQATLLDEAPDAILVRDLERRITYWSRGAERVYGWTSAEAMGKRALELLGRPGAPQGEETWRTVFEKDNWIGELTHLTKAGLEITVVSRHTLLRDALGQPIAILTINTDITEQKQLEAQFLRVQRVENIGTLAGGIAHDLNNILTPVLMAADILLEQFPEGPVCQTLVTIRKSAVRGSALVNQILQFARGTKSEPVVLQLWHLVMDFSALIQDTFPRSIHIQTQVADDLQLVLVDATQLHQVLLNLCVNARDAMPEGGELRIEASNTVLNQKYFRGQLQPISGPYVVLRVSDTGVGIPATLLDKLFEPFFTTKVYGKGTGLGLSTVANIVRSHRGIVDVSSRPGQGTVFEVYLPAATGPKSPDAVAAAAEVPAGQGEHILLVDDEVAVLAMTRELLEANHYRVTSAQNGGDALKFFREHAADIDAIVTDLMMPGLDGSSLIRAVKHIAPETRIICISGLASDEKLAELDQSSVRALLRKPYSAYDFLVTLRDALS
jgi:PAS domain S-box-containing protein